MHWSAGYRIRKAEWFEEYRSRKEQLSEKVGISEDKLDQIVELFMEYGILPDMYENY